MVVAVVVRFVRVSGRATWDGVREMCCRLLVKRAALQVLEGSLFRSLNGLEALKAPALRFRHLRCHTKVELISSFPKRACG